MMMSFAISRWVPFVCCTILLQVAASGMQPAFVHRTSISRRQITNFESSLQAKSSCTNRKTDLTASDQQHRADELTLDRRRAILNLIMLSCATVPTYPANSFLLGGSTEKEVKPTTATDIAGSPIVAGSFLSKHKTGDRIMVQGLKGDPTYLIVNQNELQLESYALNAECTHLGCVVPWDPIQTKFVCPCHGSQYDSKGTVIRGPAPSPLKLAKVGLEEESGKVLLEPWTEDDFRSGEKPWWT